MKIDYAGQDRAIEVLRLSFESMCSSNSKEEFATGNWFGMFISPKLLGLSISSSFLISFLALGSWPTTY